MQTPQRTDGHKALQPRANHTHTHVHTCTHTHIYTYKHTYADTTARRRPQSASAARKPHTHGNKQETMHEAQTTGARKGAMSMRPHSALPAHRDTRSSPQVHMYSDVTDGKYKQQQKTSLSQRPSSALGLRSTSPVRDSDPNTSQFSHQQQRTSLPQRPSSALGLRSTSPTRDTNTSQVSYQQQQRAPLSQRPRSALGPRNDSSLRHASDPYTSENSRLRLRQDVVTPDLRSGASFLITSTTLAANNRVATANNGVAMHHKEILLGQQPWNVRDLQKKEDYVARDLHRRDDYVAFGDGERQEITAEKPRTYIHGMRERRSLFACNRFGCMCLCLCLCTYTHRHRYVYSWYAGT
jgi:hypothetical protein